MQYPSDKERREQVANQAYNANPITFSKAKEGAMEAYNFLANASITTIYSTNKMDWKLVATAKTFVQSTFSFETGTSKVTDREDEEDNLYDKAGKANEQVGHRKMAIDGMKIIRKETEGSKEKMETLDVELDLVTKEAASNTNKLQLGSNSDGVHNTEEEMVHPNMDDDEGKDYTSAEGTGEEDSGMNRTINYNSNVMEVSPGKFEAEFSNTYENPKDFKQKLCNSAGPLPESMILYINIVKKELEDANNRLPFDLTPYGRLYKLLVKESGGEYKDNLCYQEMIKDELVALAGIDQHNKPLLKN